MSIFNELILPKITEIPKAYVKSFNDDLKAAFACFQKFEEEFQNGKAKAREKSVKDKTLLTTLQSIDEDEDEPKTASKVDSKSSTDRSSTDSSSSKRGSKKRSKNEVDGMSSPEQEKRHKRNASVKAQSIISKQVNVNLTQKLRRENSTEKSSNRRRGKDDDKENTEPIIPAVQIKQEKISIAPEPMDMESIPLNIEVKQELDKDDIAMPPPSMPVPKQRKAAQKDKVDETSDEEPARRRTTRTKKQADAQPVPVASTRSTRASNRATKQTDSEESIVAEARPKRTRGKKAAQETSTTDTDKDSQSTQDSGIASPAEKPRPKRTRKLQKNKKDEEPPKEVEIPAKEAENQQPLVVKEERISQPDYSSPLLQKIVNKTNKANDKTLLIESRNITENGIDEIQNGTPDGIENGNKDLEDTRVISKAMDATVVLPNGVFNHASVSPKNNRNMNETVVIETCNQTVVLDKPKLMDSTVVIDKGSKTNLTDDNSLLTDDDSVEMKTPPKQPPILQQPTSAVKEKVQQFEEMASRVTRTKTRAMKKEVQDEPDNQTPPDKVSKVMLSADNLSKMNSMIFNGKSIIPVYVSNSASKPRVNTTSSVKGFSSTSKLSGINKAREAAEEFKMEDARRKKEAMLEAKREMQKKKREEKMAAAAAAREAAERERRLALAAAAREKQEKQLHADMGKLEKMREVEKKKQELARKVQETEERRKAEELARQKRLEEEQRKAGELRKRQLEEADKMKKEAALMAREIERKQREFIEKQKLKQRMEEVSSAMKTPRKYPPIEPVYMEDGFQYLNSDEEADPVERPIPTWSTSKARYRQLARQTRVAARHVDRLFSVRAHAPDLREIFPNIERARLKRTSSAVWRSPLPAPPALPDLAE
ncbi:inner centromere protein A isoform X2 [Zerene cesonia]|uniref:inner centromere protein A isoform X2 n=1 Tax=Zerene cesonia TaxID=33412 RepID=UPI0018E51F38|nr:inner centromere protein A isoform X2 [Zerene cesonia]